jgi:hypothetical protein
MSKKPRDPWVSPLYDPKLDAENQPRPSIKKIVNDAIKERKVRRQYRSRATPETIALTKRITGERD